MLRIILVELFTIFCAFSYSVFVTSTEYGTERVTLYGYGVLFQKFYSQKTETVYQCMELCLQYPLCKSLYYGKGFCELLKNNAFDLHFLLGTRGGKHIDAKRIPKGIAGACGNNSCRNNTKCVPHPSQSYTCVPHNFPVFACPKDWLYSNNKCFKVYLAPFSWHESKDYCAKIKANLTEIRTTEEKNFISAVLVYIANDTFGNKGYNDNNFFWISLSYHKNRESWIWDASGRVWDETSVTLLSPQYQNIELDHSSCVALNVNRSRNYTDTEWRVMNCASKAFFVCERIMLP